jgi:hypothetical protein
MSVTVQGASREIIERKLLAALDDEDKVAIIASRQDLEDLITAVNTLLRHLWSKDWPRVNALKSDLERLKKEAFG